MPKSVARLAAGLIPRIWRESASPAFVGVPGRASDPIEQDEDGFVAVEGRREGGVRVGATDLEQRSARGRSRPEGTGEGPCDPR